MLISETQQLKEQESKNMSICELPTVETTVETTVTLEQAIARLEQVHGKTWGMYFNGNGQYILELGINADNHRNFGPSNDLKQLVTAAANWRFMPIYPRMPLAPMRDRFTVAKTGSSWTVLLDERGFRYNFRTKKEAEATIDRTIECAQQARMEWYDNVLPLTAGKVEGVDFRYGD